VASNKPGERSGPGSITLYTEQNRRIGEKNREIQEQERLRQQQQPTAFDQARSTFGRIQNERRNSGRAAPAVSPTPQLYSGGGPSPQDTAIAGQRAGLQTDTGEMLTDLQRFGNDAYDAAQAKIAYEKAGGVEGELSRMTPRQRSEAEARGRVAKRQAFEAAGAQSVRPEGLTEAEHDAKVAAAEAKWNAIGSTANPGGREALDAYDAAIGDRNKAYRDAPARQADLARRRQEAQRNQVAGGAALRDVDNARLGATINAPKAPTVPGKKSVIKLSDGSNGVYNERDGTVERLNEGPPMSPDAAKALRIASRAKRGESNVVSTVVGDRIVTKKYDDAGQEIGIEVKEIGPNSGKPISMSNIQNAKGETVNVLIETDQNGNPKLDENGNVKMREFKRGAPPTSNKPRSIGKGVFNGKQGEWYKTGDGPATFSPLPDDGSFGTKPKVRVEVRMLPEEYKTNPDGSTFVDPATKSYVTLKQKRFGLVSIDEEAGTFDIHEMGGAPAATETVPGNGGGSTPAPVAPTPQANTADTGPKTLQLPSPAKQAQNAAEAKAKGWTPEQWDAELEKRGETRYVPVPPDKITVMDAWLKANPKATDEETEKFARSNGWSLTYDSSVHKKG
jgi:hypothetical protein